MEKCKKSEKREGGAMFMEELAVLNCGTWQHTAWDLVCLVNGNKTTTDSQGEG